MARNIANNGAGAAPLPFNFESSVTNPLTLCVDLSSEKAIN